MTTRPHEIILGSNVKLEDLSTAVDTTVMYLAQENPKGVVIFGAENLLKEAAQQIQTQLKRKRISFQMEEASNALGIIHV